MDWLAASNRPICRDSAPVYAPFSRPNSSLSMSDGRDRGAADPDHLPLMSRAQVVHGLRHHFLAGPGLAGQQHRGGGRRHLLDLLEHVRDRRAFRDDRARRPQHPHLAAQLRVLHRGVVLELAVRFERLLQRAMAGPARQRLAGDPGNQPETLDHAGRNRAILRRRAEIQRTQHRFAAGRDRQRDDRSRSETVAAEGFAIRLGEVVQGREAPRLAEFQLRRDERDRRDRERGARCQWSARLTRRPCAVVQPPAPQRRRVEVQGFADLPQAIHDGVVHRF